jgi:hypothetical protein
MPDCSYLSDIDMQIILTTRNAIRAMKEMEVHLLVKMLS